MIADCRSSSPVIGDRRLFDDSLHITLTGEELYDMERHTSSPAPRGSETHGGSDVAIFAAGPMSHLFHTTHESTHIMNVMAYSACIGPYTDDEDHCNSSGGGLTSSTPAIIPGIWLVVLSRALMTLL